MSESTAVACCNICGKTTDIMYETVSGLWFCGEHLGKMNNTMRFTELIILSRRNHEV